MTIYDPIIFINDSAPPINASALNHIQEGIVAAHTEIASQSILLASSIGYASDLAGNIGAQASAITAQASTIYGQGVAIGSLMAADIAIGSSLAFQSASVASSNAALATALPLLEANASAVAAQGVTLVAHGSQLAAHGSQLAAHGTSISEVVATVVSLASTIDDLGPQLAALDGVATTLAIQATQLAGLAPLIPAYGYGNRTGRGPFDLWDANASLIITPTAGNGRALAAAVVPNADWPVQDFSFELERNGTYPDPLGDFSIGILDELGDLIAYSTPTQVPSITASSLGATITVPNVVPSVLLSAGSRYYFLLASDDGARMLPAGVAPHYSALPGLVERGLAFGWDLPSGLDLSLYGGFPVDQASSLDPYIAGLSGFPAVFV